MESDEDTLAMMTGLNPDGTPYEPAHLDQGLVHTTQSARSFEAEKLTNSGSGSDDASTVKIQEQAVYSDASIDGSEIAEDDKATQDTTYHTNKFYEEVAAFLDNSNLAQGHPFTFTKPPPKAWWRWGFGISSAAADVLVKVQWWAGRATAFRKNERYIANPAVWWQVQSGVTPKEWRSAKLELVKVGLLESRTFHFAHKKATWIRPTGQFLAVFGVDQETYDLAGRVMKRVKAGKPEAGSNAPSKTVLTDEEMTALSDWNRAGGYLPPLGANTKVLKPEKI